MVSSGARLGPYEITGPIGTGGMGEVYRARDTRLGRDVALKVLPEPFANDADRMARFEREARAIAALNHPNIVAVYDIGTQPDGAPYLVSELLEGQTLRALLDTGSVAQRRAVEIGIQIAQGLAAAHDKGILHRDLKPENLFVTRDSRVKILDFGIAKLIQAKTAGDTLTSVGTAAAAATQPGIVIGTAGYMSPEQVRGEELDHRADIFSFGLVVFEMLACRHAFSRTTTVETLAAILREDPPALPESTPAALRQIVARCLEKEPQNRFESARDLAFALHTLAGSASTPVTDSSVPPRRSRRPWILPAAGTMLVLLTACGWFLAVQTPTGVNLSAYRLTPFATDSELELEGIWSPDGKSIVYRKESGGRTTLMVRGLDAPVATPVIEIPQARNIGASRSLFWSRDSNHVYYVSEGHLWMVARSGGDSQRVFEHVAGADLSPDGNALVLWRSEPADKNIRSGMSVSSPPGASPREYSPFTGAAGVPKFSPDGKRIVLRSGWVLPYPQGGKTQPKHIPALSPGPESLMSWMPDSRHVITNDSAAVNVFEGSRGLRIIDVETGRTVQLTAAIVRDVYPSVSPDGNRLVFAARSMDFNIVELPLDGSAPQPILASSHNDYSPSWSPDGTEIVYSTERSGQKEIWVRNLPARWDRVIVTKRDLPEGTTDLTHPIFSPDGSRVAFVRYSEGATSVWIAAASGGNPVRVTAEHSLAPNWSPDGKMLAVLTNKTAAWQIALVPVGANQPLRMLEKTPSCGAPPDWSPTGEWIACETSQDIVLVSPDGKSSRVFPRLNSRAIGFSRNGQILYSACEERGRSMLKALDIRTGSVRTIADYGSQFQVSGLAPLMARMSVAPDGKRLVTSVRLDRSDLWLLEGFPQPRPWWAVWRQR